MSSLRNAVQRRNHKERAQPIERSKWGLLEKHKDYSLRAKDHNEKRQRLKLLRDKASDRNPDEFHFGMMSARVGKNGKKLGDRGNKQLSQEVVKLLKTQDVGYLRTVLQRTRRERERLEMEILIDEREGGAELKALKGEGGEKRRHAVFVESRDEQREFDPEEWFGTDDMGLEKSYNRPRRTSAAGEEAETEAKQPPKSRKQLEAEEQAAKDARKELKKKTHSQESRQRMLKGVRQREQELVAAEQELEQQRAMMSNTIGGVNRNGVKFRMRERKR
jgi:U3 small nucleolar RNA-associated protein 11